MQIGIISSDLNYEVLNPEVMDRYYGVEIGMLKINPERMPMLVSQEQGYAEMNRWGEKDFDAIEIFDGDYVLVAENAALEYEADMLILCGTGYILRKQGKTSTGISFNELMDVKEYLSEVELRSEVMADRDDRYYGCYVFVADEDEYYYD